MTTVDDALGPAIKRARAREGLSQKELGDELGASQAQISRWERGRGQPSEEQLAALKQVLGRIVRRRDGNGPALAEREPDAPLPTVPEPAPL